MELAVRPLLILLYPEVGLLYPEIMNAKSFASNSNVNSSGTVRDQVSQQPRTLKTSGWGMEALMKAGAWLFFFLSGFAIYAGFKLRHKEYLTAENGTGYMLGILGSIMMLVLLLYSARKRYRFMAGWGSISHWFRYHMILGVLGPICILYHSNFSLGSTNSSVALFSMLLVAGSGLIGRYLYVQIHYGLYGRRMNLKELTLDLEEEKGSLSNNLVHVPNVKSQLIKFSNSILSQSKGFIYSLGVFFFMRLRTRWAYRNLRGLLKKNLKVEARRQGWSSSIYRKNLRNARLEIWHFLRQVRKVAEFNVYERLFALWHLFHIPLLVMMLIAGVFHVVAVHAY
jgi:hypothetical protein